MGTGDQAVADVLRAAPARTAVLLDFDGTLAPIVDDPDRAVPLAGTYEALAALHGHYAVVAVISGRPVDYLRRHLPEGVTVAGLYGLETLVDGTVVAHPDSAAWRSAIDAAAASARAELPNGVTVEHKGLSLTIHVRTAPSLAHDVERWATATAERSGLEVRRARMSAELHPPIAADKGTVVRSLLGGVETACFIGDDVGDGPAFDALDAFAAGGGRALRLVVRSSELDPSLAARADALLEGPAAVLELLQALAP